MIPQKTKCFVIIVHFGTDFVTKQCLASLCQSSLRPDLIIIVDHGLIPFALPATYQEYCQVIRPAKNGGYGAGFNVGLKALQAHRVQDDDLVVSMNNDVVAASDTIFRLTSWWERQKLPTLAGSSMRTINMFTGRAKKVSSSIMPKLPIFKPYIDGAFVVSRLQTWKLLGGFTEEYFLYSEDVLLSWRAARLGITIKAIHELNLQHADKGSSSLDKLYYVVRNGAVLLERESPWLWRVYWKIMNHLRLLGHTLAPVSERRLVVRQALRDARL